MTTDTRKPMSPSEFDAKCRELRRRCPWLSETSGARTKARNANAGGIPDSKHVFGGHNAVAQDFGADGPPAVRSKRLNEAAIVARELGFWVLVHDVGSGDHLHVQGLAPGPVPQWWIDLYATETGVA